MSSSRIKLEARVPPEAAGRRLDQALAALFPEYSRTRIKSWIDEGRVLVDGAVLRAKTLVVGGETVQVDVEIESSTRVVAQEIPLVIVHEDDDLLVVDKPAGMTVHPAPGHPRHTLVNAILAHCPEVAEEKGTERPGIVHRLDKDTSGVLLIARTPGSAAFFSRRFSGRSARKIYWALVVGIPEIADGLIDLPLAKQPGTGGEKMHVDEEGGQPARTRYRVIDRAGNRATWVELQPLTGRTHQLRVHMAAIGHPIVGDGKYGDLAEMPDGMSKKLHLHARRITFPHPKGGTVDVSAPIPGHMRQSFETCGFDPDRFDITEAGEEDEKA